jgi:hypothetical protein
MADFRHFLCCERHATAANFSGCGAFRIDNLSREGHALAALWLHAERAIRLAGAHCALARRCADIPFSDSIANANDHLTLTSLILLSG